MNSPRTFCGVKHDCEFFQAIVGPGGDCRPALDTQSLSDRSLPQAKALDAALRRRIGRIRTHLDDIGVLHLYTKDHNFNASRMVRKAERNLENTYRNFDVSGVARGLSRRPQPTLTKASSPAAHRRDDGGPHQQVGDALGVRGRLVATEQRLQGQLREEGGGPRVAPRGPSDQAGGVSMPSPMLLPERSWGILMPRRRVWFERRSQS